MNAVAPITGYSPEPAELEFTILMPCLNEAETIGICVAKALAFLMATGIRGEVLVADNGSSDGSQRIASHLGARVVAVEEKGYGAALAGGIEAARGRYIIMGDADDSYDFSALDAFVQSLRGGADLVMGNRFRGGIEKGAMPFLHRYLGNPVLSFLGRALFRTSTGDFHCGLRGFNAGSIRALALRTSGMEFASEMVVRSALAGLRIEEVPTRLQQDGRSRPPHLKTWRDGWRHLKFLLMHNPRWLFFYPGAALAGLGLLLAGVLYFGPLHVEADLTLDLNTFIAACFMLLTGSQLVTFGLLSRYYCARTGILPATRGSDWITRHVSTDRLALVSALLLIVGGSFFGFALWRWASLGFGPLTAPYIPRTVVFGLTMVAVALQLFFSAFVLGILEVPLRRSDAGRPANPPRR